MRILAATVRLSSLLFLERNVHLFLFCGYQTYREMQKMSIGFTAISLIGDQKDESNQSSALQC